VLPRQSFFWGETNQSKSRQDIFPPSEPNYSNNLSLISSYPSSNYPSLNIFEAHLNQNNIIKKSTMVVSPSAKLVSNGITKLSGSSPRLKVTIPVKKLSKVINGTTRRLVHQTTARSLMILLNPYIIPDINA
jgi:hypothetical protein